MSRLNRPHVELQLGPAPYQAVSIEEEVLLVMGAVEDQNRIEQELDNIQRMQSTATTLSDVVTYSPAINQATHMDLFLLESAADLAAAGSDIQAEEVIPSIEKYVGKQPNMEGFKSFVKGLWRSIMAALRAVWDAVTGFLAKVIGLIPRMRHWLTYYRYKLDRIPRTWNWDPSLKLGTELFTFSVKDKLPKNNDELLDRIDLLVEYQEFYHGEFLDTAKQCYEDLTFGLYHFDESNLESSLNALCDDVQDLATRNAPPKMTLKPVTDNRFGQGGYWALPDMPGDRTMFIRRVAIASNSSPLERAETIQLNTPTIQDTKLFRKPREFGETMFPTPKIEELEKMITAAFSMCDYMERYHSSMRELEARRVKMIEGTEDLVERIESMRDESYQQPKDTAYYRAAIRFNGFVTAAVAQPCNHLATLSIRSVRAILAILSRVFELNNLKRLTD